jgi:hypothetical protein
MSTDSDRPTTFTEERQFACITAESNDIPLDSVERKVPVSQIIVGCAVGFHLLAPKETEC